MRGKGEGEPLSPTEEIIRGEGADKIKELPSLQKKRTITTERGVTSSARRRLLRVFFTPVHGKVAGTEVTHGDFRRTVTTTLHLSRSAGPGGTNRRQEAGFD